MTVMFGRGASGTGDPEVSDSERRHAASVKFGTVHEVDYAQARVRVAIGDEDDDDGHLVTGWLPMLGGRARGDSEWHPLEKGERVVVLSESGELQNAAVIPAGIYSDDDPAPGDKAGLWRKKFSDGGIVEYDRESGEFLVDAKSKATLRVGGSYIEVTEVGVKIVSGGMSISVGESGIDIGDSAFAALRVRANRVEVKSGGTTTVIDSGGIDVGGGGSVSVGGEVIHAPGGGISI